MIYAIDKENRKIQPEPHMRAICPICNGEVTAKCGDIITWHWAHIKGSDCDDWCENDDEWTNNWKKLFPSKNCEVEFKGRRADIITKYNEIIKLQRKMLSPMDLYKREIFYGNLIWIFDVRDAVKNIEFRMDQNQNNGYASFRWKHPKKTLAYTTKPTILDLGNEKIFLLVKMYKSTPCGGYGYFISKEDILNVNISAIYNFRKKIDKKEKWFTNK